MFEAQLKGSICAWCVNGCTNANDNKCEPKAFLDGKESAEPGTVKDYETCLNGKYELNLYTYFCHILIIEIGQKTYNTRSLCS